jgi:hypothetical protein
MIITALSLVATMTTRWRVGTLIFLSYWSLNWSRVIGDRKPAAKTLSAITDNKQLGQAFVASSV